MFCGCYSVLWVGLQCVIVVFSGHTHLLFYWSYSLVFKNISMNFSLRYAVLFSLLINLKYCGISLSHSPFSSHMTQMSINDRPIIKQIMLIGFHATKFLF